MHSILTTFPESLGLRKFDALAIIAPCQTCAKQGRDIVLEIADLCGLDLDTVLTVSVLNGQSRIFSRTADLSVYLTFLLFLLKKKR